MARAAALAVLLTLSLSSPTYATPERIGVYDSRAIAYAYFWSEAGTNHRNALVADVRAANTAGEVTAEKQAEAALHDYDRRNHLAVFSTAPADEALTALAPAIPAILAEHRVTRLVSKWDVDSLAVVPDAERVDVTASLVATFNLPTQKRHVVDEIVSHEPLPLERARELQREGKL